MRFTPSRGKHGPVEPDMTPMVDVVFLLIIFFLATSSMAELTRERLELPRQPGRQSARSETATVVVNVTSDGRYLVERRTLTLAQLTAMLDQQIAAQAPEQQLELLVRADRAAPLLYINQLAQVLIERNLRDWRLATEPAAPRAEAAP